MGLTVTPTRLGSLPKRLKVLGSVDDTREKGNRELIERKRVNRRGRERENSWRGNCVLTFVLETCAVYRINQLYT